MENPLRQFAIHTLIPIHIAGYDVSFTNSSLLMTIAFALIVLLFFVGTSRKAVVPAGCKAPPRYFMNSPPTWWKTMPVTAARNTCRS